MINWIDKNAESCEGNFESNFFRNDENGKTLWICIENSDILEYAEKCVESFNNLSDSVITEICKGIVDCAKSGGINEDFELPTFENPIDILNYCWFTTLRVSVPDDENQISYVVEGEGDWGEVVGFVIKNNKLVYVGVDYDDYEEF